ncbi:hypothetical protein ASPZODRAFT_1631609 [Penicilliopsis zonata CBS 506.65]|uniref:Zn(2)-C6 fungal-type domain-containing protein n=1 Tax=Penicilliopsis zonata CBS 506.65 TaxID=1073090 RepID=A0A1L9SMV9_9EURO|nr:hypothetical protein ASPZODRAFT_1631609 [Penicilliopsis zonata CBS 506.65]OJJ48602.1 hypothetical protein ASPZODRAFT_1631609 [Penicilliopsis zonata CBS 506.65]
MLGRKLRSKTGCWTCRIRKVKCDEEKIDVAGQKGPQCRRCATARLACEWKCGAVAHSTARVSSRRSHRTERRVALNNRPTLHVGAPASPLLNPTGEIQAGNSLVLSRFDRDCLSYIKDSVLVVALGKHWPWSPVSYAYHRIAVKEPMVMSVLLATAASEIHRSRLYNLAESDGYHALLNEDLADVEGQVHYGRALSGLREALKLDVKSPERLETIFITLFMMIDYEHRFGSGAAAISVHMRGIITLLFNNIVPSLAPVSSPNEAEIADSILELSRSTLEMVDRGDPELFSPDRRFDSRLRDTVVPVLLLVILYFCTQGPLFGLSRFEVNLFRLFYQAESTRADLALPKLYKLSRLSSARFWGEQYPAAARLDDLENLAGLTLYHKAHIMQFKITDLFQKCTRSNDWFSHLPWDGTVYKQLMDDFLAISDEYDTLLSSALAASSCEIAGDGRRVVETIYWSSIAFYGAVVYFYLCFRHQVPNEWNPPRGLSLEEAVSHVLELSLKMHRSRPRLMVRIACPLFLAGIATTDKIYQDWVSVRLKDLRGYGQNFARISARFDELLRGSYPISFSTMHQLIVSQDMGVMSDQHVA